jgi:hypothetical protein
MLRKGWTLGSAQMLRVLQAAIAWYHPQQVRLLEQYFRQEQPDLVVSVIPHFNRALCESLRKACPAAKFVTILTDLANYPPRFWIETQEQFLVCGTEKAVEQARERRPPRTTGSSAPPA